MVSEIVSSSGILFTLARGEPLSEERAQSLLDDDMTGRRFGRWTVLADTGRRKRGIALWSCRCDCGTVRNVLAASLTGGKSKSCGCLQRQKTTARQTSHGMSGSRAYRIWGGMIQRCTNPRRAKWATYGGRGITVCERWRTFENFYADMGDPPAGASIDRIDNDRGYEPGNCRWEIPKRQSRNQTKTVTLTLNGRTMPLMDWADELGISPRTLHTRVRAGWSDERALTEGVHDRGQKGGAS